MGDVSVLFSENQIPGDKGAMGDACVDRSNKVITDIISDMQWLVLLRITCHGGAGCEETSRLSRGGQWIFLVTDPVIALFLCLPQTHTHIQIENKTEVKQSECPSPNFICSHF